jgi:hypothetical protein
MMALPDDLADLASPRDLRNTVNSLTTTAPMPFSSLCALAGLDPGTKATTRIVRLLSGHLARLGWGLEPDPDLQGEPVRSDVTLIKATRAGQSFLDAALAAACLVPGNPELAADEMATALADAYSLTADERVRLAARVHHLAARSLAPAKITAAFLTKSRTRKEQFAWQALAAAQRLGPLGPLTTDLLRRLSQACATGDAQGPLQIEDSALEPIVVERRSRTGGSYRIPAPPDAAPPPPERVFEIDLARLELVRAETREVAQLLSPIYEELPVVEMPDRRDATPQPEPDTEAPAGFSTVPMPGGEAATVPGFTGLDSGHAQLLTRLVAQESWSREAFETRAREHDLMPDGALEAINEWSFDHYNDALIEDGDPITINLALLEATGEMA